MRYVVWIAEDAVGYFTQCRAAGMRPYRSRSRARTVWSKGFERSGEALSFVEVAVTVAERLTGRREAARLAALVAGRLPGSI